MKKANHHRKARGSRRGRRHRHQHALTGALTALSGPGPRAEVAAALAETETRRAWDAPSPSEQGAGAFEERPAAGGLGATSGGAEPPSLLVTESSDDADAALDRSPEPAHPLAEPLPELRGVRSLAPGPLELTHDLVPQDLVPESRLEFVYSRLGHLSRRLEDLHQAEIHRAGEERRETWLLVGALGVVLVFCFAAFFMNQMEVRDLRVGLEEQLERRSNLTIASLEEALDGLARERLPKLQAAVEKSLKDKARQDGDKLQGLMEELQTQGRKSEAQLAETVQALEARLSLLLKLSREIQDEQLKRQSSDPSGAPPGERAAAQPEPRVGPAPTAVARPNGQDS